MKLFAMVSGAGGEQASGEVGFRGCFEHTMDGKGRVSLPAPFRNTLSAESSGSIVLTNFICDGARCLDGFSVRSWSEFEQKLRSRSRFDPQLRKLENYYLARAVECPLDASGRINVPPPLRTYAGLDKDIVFTAALKGFRVWDRRVWDLIFGEAEASLLEDPGLFMGVDL